MIIQDLIIGLTQLAYFSILIPILYEAVLYFPHSRIVGL